MRSIEIPDFNCNMKEFVEFVRKLYNTDQFIPLHEPVFLGNERKYVNECIDSTFVSSVGKFVDQFEQKIAQYTGAKYAVAAVNGTAALHIALILRGVGRGDEVLTQPLSFVATSNAIKYTGADPVFVDVDRDTLGLSPEKLDFFLKRNAYQKEGYTYNKNSQKPIQACVPMHTYGHPCRIDEIMQICQRYNITVIEDAAESLGSFYKKKHTGTFGEIGILSFNGNKIITTGGGGMIITDDEYLAEQAKHLTTQAKVSHPWEYVHDRIGYNYRLTNITAALGVAQLENLEEIVENKRELAREYGEFFGNFAIDFFTEPANSRSNYWLNVILLNNRKEKDEFLEYTNDHGVMTRPAWKLMNKLDMFKGYWTENIENAEWIENRLVNIPSGFRNL
jgi:aminotransferase in exopolysaccharide biosynthesis